MLRRTRSTWLGTAALLLLVAAGESAAQTAPFRRGDASADASWDVRDALDLLGYLFAGAPRVLACDDAADANDDGELDVSDAAAVLNFVFLGAAPLPPPLRECGVDPTPDGLSCAAFAPCRDGPALYRITELFLRDPHVFADVPIVGCRDLTDQGVIGQPSVNEGLATLLGGDADGDGFVDLSLLLEFRPPPAATRPGGGSVSMGLGLCSLPSLGLNCGLDPDFAETTYTTRLVASCLTPDPDTLSPRDYQPAVESPRAPCFVSTRLSEPFIGLAFSGTVVPLHGLQCAAELEGDPSDVLTVGLLAGFLTEEDASVITLDAEIPVVGGEPLRSVLPGGRGCCASHNDRDQGPDGEGGTTRGWWFYLEFRADRLGAE
jgi:hypothetical protein